MQANISSKSYKVKEELKEESTTFLKEDYFLYMFDKGLT